MTTYRERREARAERLREWADKREEKADADYEQARQMGDAIPFGQPILVGHHSERRDRNYRARMAGAMDRSVAHGRKAEEMRRKADNVEAAAARAIYDDDPDAIERLTVKLAGLEAERERIKAHNKKARAEGGEPLPRYVLANLGGTIKTTRDRLARLTGLRDGTLTRRPRLMAARYGGECLDCATPIEKGDTIAYTKGEGARHAHHLTGEEHTP